MNLMRSSRAIPLLQTASSDTDFVPKSAPSEGLLISIEKHNEELQLLTHQLTKVFREKLRKYSRRPISPFVVQDIAIDSCRKSHKPILKLRPRVAPPSSTRSSVAGSFLGSTQRIHQRTLLLEKMEKKLQALKEKSVNTVTVSLLHDEEDRKKPPPVPLFSCDSDTIISVPSSPNVAHSAFRLLNSDGINISSAEGSPVKSHSVQFADIEPEEQIKKDSNLSATIAMSRKPSTKIETPVESLTRSSSIKGKGKLSIVNTQTQNLGTLNRAIECETPISLKNSASFATSFSSSKVASNDWGSIRSIRTCGSIRTGEGDFSDLDSVNSIRKHPTEPTGNTTKSDVRSKILNHNNTNSDSTNDVFLSTKKVSFLPPAIKRDSNRGDQKQSFSSERASPQLSSGSASPDQIEQSVEVPSPKVRKVYGI